MRDESKTRVMSGWAARLEECLGQVEASKSWFHDRVLPLSIAQLKWRPDPASWSIVECLDHLNLTIGLYLPKIDKAIQKGIRPNAGDPVSTTDQCEINAVRLIEPPADVAEAAPAPLEPAAAVDLDWLVDRFHLMRDRYVDALRRTMNLDLAHVRIVQPLHPFLRTLGGTLAFLAAHERRHIWQAEEVRNKSKFPRAVFTI
jgi:DinB superfamily